MDIRQKLILTRDKLGVHGLTREASIIDSIIVKIAFDAQSFVNKMKEIHEYLKNAKTNEDKIKIGKELIAYLKPVWSFVSKFIKASDSRLEKKAVNIKSIALGIQLLMSIFTMLGPVSAEIPGLDTLRDAGGAYEATVDFDATQSPKVEKLKDKLQQRLDKIQKQIKVHEKIMQAGYGSEHSEGELAKLTIREQNVLMAIKGIDAIVNHSNRNNWPEEKFNEALQDAIKNMQEDLKNRR